MYKLIDFNSKLEVNPGNLVFTGNDSPWEVVMDINKIKQSINLDYFIASKSCLAKYIPLMPINTPAHFVSLQEIATPLIKSISLGRELGIDLYFKVEGKNPTGSFKDRGSAVEVTIAKQHFAKGIVLASTGNMAASCACYAARAKIPCYIVIPEGVPLGKLAQVILYGGRIVQVKGSYNDAAKMAQEIATELNFYLAGDYAFRIEGQKTAAFEIIDQLLFQVPDYVILPMGCGTNIAAYYKGFNEYQQLGLIDHTPQLIGIQAAGASAVVDSYQQNSNKITELLHCDTIASAIAVPNPIDGVKALAAIYASQGNADSVTDQEILFAQSLLATAEGLFVESAAAATIAYLLKQSKQTKLEGKKVVCVLTGDGLKDPGVILKNATIPPAIAANANEFVELFNFQEV